MQVSPGLLDQCAGRDHLSRTSGSPICPRVSLWYGSKTVVWKLELETTYTNKIG
jgi:hypothetical protein